MTRLDLTNEQKQMINDAVNQVYRQGEPSATESGDMCRYTNGELHCVVGYMIDEEKYTPDMEEQDVNDLINGFGDDIFHTEVNEGAIRIMWNLQMIHDEYVVSVIDMDEEDKPSFRKHWVNKVNGYSDRNGLRDWLHVKDD